MRSEGRGPKALFASQNGRGAVDWRKGGEVAAQDDSYSFSSVIVLKGTQGEALREKQALSGGAGRERGVGR